MSDQAESSSAGAKKLLKANVNGSQSDYELPWVEKYRPVYLDDVVGNTETVERLKIIGKDGNMPVRAAAAALNCPRSLFHS